MGTGANGSERAQTGAEGAERKREPTGANGSERAQTRASERAPTGAAYDKCSLRAGACRGPYPTKPPPECSGAG